MTCLHIFRRHDLVFASARSALEAMATGCAVIVLDGRGFAGLVTHDVVSNLARRTTSVFGC